MREQMTREGARAILPIWHAIVCGILIGAGLGVLILLCGCRDAKPKPEVVSNVPLSALSNIALPDDIDRETEKINKEMETLAKRIEFASKVNEVNQETVLVLVACLRVAEETFRENNCKVRLDKNMRDLESIENQACVLYPQAACPKRKSNGTREKEKP